MLARGADVAMDVSWMMRTWLYQCEEATLID